MRRRTVVFNVKRRLASVSGLNPAVCSRVSQNAAVVPCEAYASTTCKISGSGSTVASTSRNGVLPTRNGRLARCAMRSA